MDLIYAIFPSEPQAQRAIEKLVDNEFSATNIYVLMRAGKPGAKVQEVPVRTKTLVGPGVAIGATLGAIGGALVAVSGGLFLAAGPLVALLQGVVTGGAAGSLAGTVGGLGYWRDQADFPAGELEAGAVLVGVDANAQGQLQRASAALTAAGADAVHVRSWNEAREDVRQA